MKTTVYIPVEKWKRGESGGWGDGQTGGCANTFIQKSQGIMSHFGSKLSKLDPVVTGEIIRINDDEKTPDSYKKLALSALLEPYEINLVFIEPPCAVKEPVSVTDSDEGFAEV